MLRLDIPSGEF